MSRRYALNPPSQPAFHVSYENELNPEQLQVVTAPDGPLLILAGPGSGKTRTLTYRVAYLLEKGIPPDRILLVTFTVKAAREMLDRVERILKFRPEGLWGGTFHHIGNLILRRHAELLNRTPVFGILDEEDAKDLLAACINDMRISPVKNRLPQANVVVHILSLAANTCRPFEEILEKSYPQFLDAAIFIRQVAETYRKRKEKANVMDYDDLLTLWLHLMKEHAEVRRSYAQQFQYILVDEYQDTNRIQFELVQQIASFHRNVLVVGDDAQAIYAFRGANVHNLLQFSKVFPDARIFRLETNYRSTPQILALANRSIQCNQNQFPKELRATRDSGSSPAVVPLSTAKQQAAFIAQRILELREDSVALEEIAVLFRARYQAAELELELAKRNIPYLVRGGVRFFEQAHIKDVLAYLRILVNPQDELSWQRILRLQEGIGPVYARQIWEAISKGVNPMEEVREGQAGKSLPARAKTALKCLRDVLKKLERFPLQKPSAILMGILPTYSQYAETHFENAKDRKEDLEQLINMAEGYQSTERLIVDLTLREPFKGESLQGWKEPDEFLVLSTIHQAKGLEWRVVFVVGLVDTQFPHPKSIEDLEALEEERRLFYVAVTRTKDELYLTYPLTRYSYQRGEVILRPSLFLQELPEDLFELWRVSEEERLFNDSPDLLQS